MALGMPVVARREPVADLMDPARDRVALFRPGDRAAFHRCLAEMVGRVQRTRGRRIVSGSTPSGNG